MIVMGFAAKLYRNTGTYAVPIWTLIDEVKDNTLTFEADEVDVTTRAGGGFRQTEPGLIDAGLEFQINWDTSDDNFTALRTAFAARTAIEMLALDGLVATAGSQGLRFTGKVISFSRNEPIGENLTVDVTVKPCIADNAPAWYTVTT